MQKYEQGYKDSKCNKNIKLIVCHAEMVPATTPYILVADSSIIIVSIHVFFLLIISSYVSKLKYIALHIVRSHLIINIISELPV